MTALFLPKVLDAWGKPEFESVSKKEIEKLGHKSLPLQAGLKQSGYALDDNLSATILKSEEYETEISIKAGIFYHGIIAGCSCADDPSPTDIMTEYCEVVINISKCKATTTITLQG